MGCGKGYKEGKEMKNGKDKDDMKMSKKPMPKKAMPKKKKGK